MSFLTVEEIGTILGGRWLRSPHQAVLQPLGVATDTREEVGGRLFLALAGERYDAHHCLDQAIEGGAAMLVLEAGRCPAVVPGNGPVLLVEDTRAALWTLAEHWRRRLRARVVAITGSAGKTTVRRMVQAILEASLREEGRGSLTASVKSFNNELGVPLTILRARPEDRYLVLEVGTNEAGEIARLGALVQPDLAAITNVARAHLEGLGSLEGVADEKASLLGFLPADGIAVVPVEDEGPLAAAVARCLTPGARRLRFGTGAGDLVLAERSTVDPTGAQSFRLADGFSGRLALPGAHNVFNAVVALGLARSLGIADRVSETALAGLPPDPMRFSAQRLGVTRTMLYNDVYNSNPDALTAALQAFGELSEGSSRRIVVLGDMMELGEDAPDLHAEVADELMRLDRGAPLDVVVLVGSMMRHCEQRLMELGFGGLVVRTPELDEVRSETISGVVRDGDAILVKGSRSIHLERLVEAIRARVDAETGQLVGAA
ncbi:MAG: UDP-N-acetylmuramoyl-tripeptide--D-alanyl-D-alanine ligase [Planctomycetota bacterium]|nr:UDP-N-acetylmuramoyl-tripeptide--D-alanyl-D-alanine ligase [Planctomycetota bacterium]